MNFDKTYNLEHLNSCNQEDQEILNLNKEKEYEVNKVQFENLKRKLKRKTVITMIMY